MNGVETPYPESVVKQGEVTLWLGEEQGQKMLCLIAPPEHPVLGQFEGHSQRKGEHIQLYGPCNSPNAMALREVLPELKPRPLGLYTSAGFGDRLGIATPGHVRALRSVGGLIAPIFAQQSIREMSRTHRSPQEVLDDATWGAFEAGWHQGVGADADHLKTTEDIDRCAVVGFSFFTLDPSAYVDNAAATYKSDEINQKLDMLPWASLQSSRVELEGYVGQVVDLGHRKLVLDQEGVWRFAVKYGSALAHVLHLYRHLEGRGIPFELEVSVDESDSPTTALEHYLFARELARLGVRFVSLAPRFVGHFEKGVDFIGDLDVLAQSLQDHAAIARLCGPYKLSLHSGSDKFSVYPLIAEATQGLVHLKTAGTSYLEALRVVAQKEPDLFRAIWALAQARFETDKASYHISGRLEKAPAPGRDEEWADLLEQFDARQILHVTFGSVLGEFKPALMQALRQHQEAHYRGLATHFERHLHPFARWSNQQKGRA